MGSDEAGSSGKTWVVIFTACVAAAAPVTAAVYGEITKTKEIELAKQSKDKDIALAQRDQAFRTQSWFLENAVDPQKTPELRQQVLRFIKASSSDDALKGWASAELTRVDELVTLSRQVAAKETEVADHEEEVARVRKEAAKQTALAGKNAAEAATTKAKLAEATEAKERAENEAARLRKQLAAKGGGARGDANYTLPKGALVGSDTLNSKVSLDKYVDQRVQELVKARGQTAREK
jgi:hypothetical protein